MSLILALDTTTNLCACAVSRGGELLARISADIGKGHGEYVMGQMDDLLARAGVSIGEIDRLGVGCGPGSFTGIRVGVALVRGLALALEVPAIGISRFAAIQYLVPRKLRPLTIILRGYGGVLYAQHFDAAGCPISEPFQGAVEEIAACLLPQSILSGAGAVQVAEIVKVQTGLAPLVVEVDPLDEIEAIAALTAKAPLDALRPPVPLYLRAPDAKPQVNFALPRQ